MDVHLSCHGPLPCLSRSTKTLLVLSHTQGALTAGTTGTCIITTTLHTQQFALKVTVLIKMTVADELKQKEKQQLRVK